MLVRRVRPIAAFCLITAGALACFPSSEGLTGGELPLLPGNEGGSSGSDVFVPDAPSPDGATTRPTSCLDAKNRGVRTNDGDVEIDPDGVGAIPSFTVFCAGMGTAAPKEYLSLVNTIDPGDPSAFSMGSNVSGYQMVSGQAGAFSCKCPDNTVRAFTRVRLKLGTLIKIDLTDRTFSSSNRGAGAADVPSSCEAANNLCRAFAGPEAHGGASYAVAAACIAAIQTSDYGRGNVDLRGTAFHVLPTEIGRTDGFEASGTTAYINDGSGRRKQVEVRGGGACGAQYPGNSTTELAIEHD